MMKVVPSKTVMEVIVKAEVWKSRAARENTSLRDEEIDSTYRPSDEGRYSTIACERHRVRTKVLKSMALMSSSVEAQATRYE